MLPLLLVRVFSAVFYRGYMTDQCLIVDGGAWRLQAAGISGSGFSYPDFLLSGMEVKGVSGQKQKPKL